MSSHKAVVGVVSFMEDLGEGGQRRGLHMTVPGVLVSDIGHL